MGFRKMIFKLKLSGVKFEKGLTEEEFKFIQSQYEVSFPPDLKEFLSLSLPVSHAFINWRNKNIDNVKKINDALNWPLEGIIFDIENNDFWWDKWGQKPNDLKQAINLCIEEMKKVPKLIPICSHRYIPSEPYETDNPIFSVYQTDIIYYGINLLDYLQIEFNFKKHKNIYFKDNKYIRFWSDIVKLGN